ncbi:alkaline phosphatase family protein [Asticcacaulis solisilvae]|uniref:alkaline phosphatase family protein n=1 Tax=Asticcacaulis solisilvae TaxID=1217274 RepID=UPI003FD8E068
MLRSALKAALLASSLLAASSVHADPAAQKPRNIVVFVADGLRYGIVNKDTAPTLYEIQQKGVDFRNSHSVYPTVTTVNASVIATGHAPGDTGEYANNMYWGQRLKAGGSVVGDMEDDAVLEEVNARLGGNYLNEDSLLKIARDHGYQTAAIGKEGPVLIQDIAAVDGKSTLVIDDETSDGKHSLGVPLPADIFDAMKAAGLDTRAPDRGLNGSPGAYNMPGVLVPNSYQQQWFVDVATKVVLPRFAKAGQPFAIVYWSRDPDGTQHNNGDSLNKLSPGINGPTSLAAVRNASDNLQALIDALKAQGLYDNTDIFVTADHGFSTISRQSKTSYAATLSFPDDTMKGFLPAGFVAIDLAHALNLPLNDAYGQPLNPRFHPGGVSLIGADPQNPDIILVVGGGSDIIYLNPAKARDLAPKIVAALSKEDYTGALFADESLGPVKGALALKDARLSGTAKTPKPAIYISFADYALPSCVKKWQNPEVCSILTVDGGLQQGQGSHGALTRANTRNFMAAIGPDFKAGFADASPVSNADITPTLAHILGFQLAPKGTLVGRVIHEALPGGPDATPTTTNVVRSDAAANGFNTVLETQSADGETYLDAAGMPGRVVGLKTKK